VTQRNRDVEQIASKQYSTSSSLAITVTLLAYYSGPGYR